MAKPCCTWFCQCTLGNPAPAAIKATIPVYGTFTLPRLAIDATKACNGADPSLSCNYCLRTTLPYGGSAGCPGGDVAVCMTITGGLGGVDQPVFGITFGPGDAPASSANCGGQPPPCDDFGTQQPCPSIGTMHPAPCGGGNPGACVSIGIPLVCNGPRPWSYSTTATFLSQQPGDLAYCQMWLLFGGKCPVEPGDLFACIGNMTLPFTFSEA